jgi:hypothetical protein
VEDKRIETIQKLLRKANGAATPAEADAYFDKAQDLMVKWEIEEAMLFAAGESKDEIVQDAVLVARSGYFASMLQLLYVIGKANNVRVLKRPPSSWKKEAGATLVGWKNDIERVKMLYASLLIQVGRERKKEMRADYIRAMTPSSRAIWVNSFSMSFAVRIGQRLQEQRARTLKTAGDADSTGSMLPAVVDREEQVKNFMNGVPTTKTRSSGRKTDFAAWEQGANAADRADIGNTRIGDTKKRLNR